MIHFKVVFWPFFLFKFVILILNFNEALKTTWKYFHFCRFYKGRKAFPAQLWFKPALPQFPKLVFHRNWGFPQRTDVFNEAFASTGISTAGNAFIIYQQEFLLQCTLEQEFWCISGAFESSAPSKAAAVISLGSTGTMWLEIISISWIKDLLESKGHPASAQKFHLRHNWAVPAQVWIYLLRTHKGCGSFSFLFSPHVVFIPLFPLCPRIFSRIGAFYFQRSVSLVTINNPQWSRELHFPGSSGCLCTGHPPTAMPLAFEWFLFPVYFKKLQRDNFFNGLLLLVKLIQYLDFCVCAFKGLQIKTSLSQECVFTAALEHVWNPKFMAFEALALFQMFLIR